MIQPQTINGTTFTPKLIDSGLSRTRRYELIVTAPGLPSWGCRLLVIRTGRTNTIGSRGSWRTLDEAVQALVRSGPGRAGWRREA